MNLALETVPPSKPIGLDINDFFPGGSPVVGRTEPRSSGAPATVDTRLVNHGRLRRPIWVRCEYPHRGEVVAVFEQASIAMSGDTVEDAINGLMVEILDAFEDYSAEEANLGPGPRQQLRVLREYVHDGVEEAGRAEYRLQVGPVHRHQFERPRQGTGPISWPTRGQFRYTPR